MHALLNGLAIALESADQPLLDAWRVLFDLEIAAAGAQPGFVPMMTIQAAVSSLVPRPPDLDPAYSGPAVAGAERPLRFYELPEGGILDLVRPAQIHYDFAAGRAQIHLTPTILDAGNLEDVTMIALAPLLRRSGQFMAHAFSAARGETAVLLAGPTGSGKTTVGLALLQSGWTYLANDVALLQIAEDAVQVLPAPGAINLDPHSFSLLPDFQDRYPLAGRAQEHGKLTIPRRELLLDSELGQAAPVSIVIFPALKTELTWSLRELKPAIGLARLISESVDQWDRATYEAHLDILAQLSRQARFYDLRLPAARSADLGQLTRIIGNLVAA